MSIPSHELQRVEDLVAILRDGIEDLKVTVEAGAMEWPFHLEHIPELPKLVISLKKYESDSKAHAKAAETLKAQYEEKLKSHGEENARLQEKLKSHGEEKARLQTRKDALREQERSVNERENVAFVGHADNRSKLNQLDEDRQRLEDDRQRLDEDRQRLDEDRQRLDDNHQRLVDGRQKLEADRQKLEDDRKKLDHDVETHKVAVSKFNQTSAKDEQLRSLIENWQKRIAELASEKEKLGQRERQCRSDEAAVAEREKKCKADEDAVSTREEACRTKEANLESYSKDLQAQYEQDEELKQGEEKLRKEHEAFSKLALDTLDNSIAKAKEISGSLESSAKTVGEMSSKADELSSLLKILADNGGTISSSLDNAILQVEDLMKKLSSVQLVTDTLSTNVMEASSKINELVKGSTPSRIPEPVPALETSTSAQKRKYTPS